jgi:hypothetical protein
MFGRPSHFLKVYIRIHIFKILNKILTHEQV